METFLVTGATGFLGRALVNRLLDEGNQVRVLVRSPAKAAPLAAAGAEAVFGDVADRQSVTAAMRDVAVVYHVAGKLFEPGQPASEYQRTHVEGTKCVLEACLESPTLRVLVHCSTTGVLGITGASRLGEDAPMRPTNVYEATKAEAEMAVRDAMRAGCPAVIVRPGLVYGPGDWHLEKFFESVLRKRFRPIGREDVYLHPVYIDDLTEAFVRCATVPEALGECFNIAGSEPVSLQRLASVIAQAGGVRPPRARIPMPAARVVAALGDLLPARFRHLAPLTRSRLDFLTNSRVYDVGKARQILGFEPLTDLEEGVRRTLAWYRDNGSLGSAAPSLPVALVD